MERKRNMEGRAGVEGRGGAGRPGTGGCGRGGAGAARQPEGRAAQGRGSQAGWAAVSGRPGGESIYLAAPSALQHRPSCFCYCCLATHAARSYLCLGLGGQARGRATTTHGGHRCPLLAVAAHNSRFLGVVDEGTPRPGYVPLLSSPRSGGGALPGSVVKQGERLSPRSSQRKGRTHASGSGAAPRWWWWWCWWWWW